MRKLKDKQRWKKMKKETVERTGYEEMRQLRHAYREQYVEKTAAKMCIEN